MTRVLFIDVRNATRSQMAEALFNHYANGYAQARSCGTMPAPHVSLRAVKVMGELGIDIARKDPKAVTQALLEQADIIVLMGKGIYPRAFAPTLIWDLEDATNKSLDELRALRDQIGQRVYALVEEIRRTSNPALETQFQQQALTEWMLSV